MNKVTYTQITKEFKPTYDFTKIGMPVDYEATPVAFIDEYRSKFKYLSHLLWVLLRRAFLTEQELRLFSIWCVRQVQHHAHDKERILADLAIAEAYANGNATREELLATHAAFEALPHPRSKWDTFWWQCMKPLDHSHMASVEAASIAGHEAGIKVSMNFLDDEYRRYGTVTLDDGKVTEISNNTHFAAYDAAINKQIDKLREIFLEKETQE